MWTVISSGYATLYEMETSWTLDDLSRALAHIAIQQDLQESSFKND